MRKYDSVADCFEGHAAFFFKNPRYKAALDMANIPEQFTTEVESAMNATDPKYKNTLLKVIDAIKLEISKLENHG